MKLKKLMLLLLGVFVLTGAFAQPDPPKDPVFKYKLSKDNPKTGEVVELIITCDLPDGFHMYSTNVFCDIGPTPFVLNLNSSPDYCKVGKLTSVGDNIRFDDIFQCKAGEFHHKAEFRQKIKILKNKAVIKGKVDGQWCSESSCFMFGNPIPIKFALAVTAVGPEKQCDEPLGQEENTDTLSKPGASDTMAPQNSVPSPVNKGLNNHSYRINGPGDTAKCQVKSFDGKINETEGESNWGLFLAAFLSGLIGLLTPCVFPMIPMTVSFFMKDDKKSKLKARSMALFFGFSIIFIYTVIGTLVSAVFGPAAGNFIATHWFPNILFFIIFLVFAFSFFGAFEIVLPSSIANKADKEADKGGYYGAFFMALTLVVVSFSCTGPIVASVLANSFSGSQILRPAFAMLGFGLAFALPFSFFALFPSYLNKLPKSGGWLNSVKVVLGFIELALALKFLSIVDLTYHWHILDREIYLALWIIIFTLMGVYLLGKLKFSHDSDLPYLKVPRLMFAILTLSFVVYLLPGMWGAPLKGLAGYLPPMSSQDFDINRSIREANGLSGNICKKPSYSEQLHVPLGLNGYFDYDEAVACGKELKKPVFLDFTGHGCVNCRKMEEKVWSNPKVYKLLKEEFVIASLYVDDKKVMLPSDQHFIGRYSGNLIKTLGNKNTEIELCYFGKNQQPLYCLIDENEDLLQLPVGTIVKQEQFSPEEFAKFLEDGLAEYKKRHPKK